MKAYQSLLLFVLSIVIAAICLSIGCQGGDDDDSGDDDDDTEEECPSGEIWSPEFMECIPEECGLNRYPDAPFDDKDLIYVDASFDGESDGGAEKPYKTVADALSNAGPDTSILIAAGEYEIFESLNIDKDGLDLIGRCSYLSKIIRSRSDLYTLWINQSESNLVQGICFDHESPADQGDGTLWAIRLFFTESSEFKGNTVLNSPGRGIGVEQCNQVTVENNVIEGNTTYGIFFAASTGTVSGNEVRENNDWGICVEHCNQITVENNTVEGNTEIGIFLNRSSGRVLENEVRNTQQTEQGGDGGGIWVELSDQVTVTDNVVEGNAGGGIIFPKSTGTISGNEVRDTQPGTPNEYGYTYGHGIHVEYSSAVECSSNIVEGSTHMGIVSLGSQGGLISSNQVRGTISREKDSWDWADGIVVMSGEGSTKVEDNTVEDNDRAGILFDFSTGMIEMNGITGNYYSIVGQNHSMIEINGNTISGNTVDEIQEYEERVLPVYDKPL